MKILVIVLLTAAVLILAGPGESLARRAIGAVKGGKYVLGEVLSIDKVAYGRGSHHGVHLLVKTAKGKLSVHLGPSWYVESQRTKFALHDVVEIAGSRVVFDGKPALLATVVRKGSDQLRLRTADGTPLWVGTRIH